MLPPPILNYSVHRLAMRLRVNPVDCGGRGLCAELLSEWVQLDDWGYGIAGDGEPLLESDWE